MPMLSCVSVHKDIYRYVFVYICVYVDRVVSIPVCMHAALGAYGQVTVLFSTISSIDDLI